MDVRCHSDAEAARVSKNAHKESREGKGAEGSLPAAFLKEPQSAFSASGAAEDCNKSKSNSSADPDYCRRILVRGRDGRSCPARSLGGGGRLPLPQPRAHRPRQARGDFGESCWPSWPRVRLARGDSPLGACTL